MSPPMPSEDIVTPLEGLVEYDRVGRPDDCASEYLHKGPLSRNE